MMTSGWRHNIRYLSNLQEYVTSVYIWSQAGHFWLSYYHFHIFVYSIGFPVHPLPPSNKTIIIWFLGMEITQNFQETWTTKFWSLKNGCGPSSRSNFSFSMFSGRGVVLPPPPKKRWGNVTENVPWNDRFLNKQL